MCAWNDRMRTVVEAELKAVEHSCNHRPIGSDGFHGTPCGCIGRDGDGLPVCTAASDYRCRNRLRLDWCRLMMRRFRNGDRGGV